MNNYMKYITCVVASGLALAACDTMDTKPLESYTEEVVWNSKKTADAFVYNVYADLFGTSSSTSSSANNRMWSGMVYSEGYTPNGCNYVSFAADAFSQDNITNSYDAGINKFSLLRKCNMIIEKSAASTALSEQEKAELAAEGQFMRGMVYFAQARYMGRFVPVNRVLDTDDTEAFKTPLTASVAESYSKYIIPDLEAGTLMPETSDAGRLNRYVAYAYLSEACLQAYAYTQDASYLTKAISAADEVINSGQYSIADADRFANMFQDAGKNDNEIIFAVYKLAVNTTVSSIREIINMFPNISTSNHKVTVASTGERIQVCFPEFNNPNGQSFIGWEFYCPTADIADAFLVIDQKDGQPKPYYETSQFTEATEDDLANIKYACYTYALSNADDVKAAPAGSVGSNYTLPEQEDMTQNTIKKAWRLKADYKGGKNISELMYENRDKRFYATMVYDSCTWMNELVTYHCNGNAWRATRNYGSHTSLSNYHYRKQVYHTTTQSYATNQTDYHVVLMRLGRVYLNKAEALLHQGKYAEAINMLNVTRTNHGALPAATASSLEEAWKIYKNERRCDLAFENDYYYSLLRWGMVGGYANNGRPAGEVIEELTTPVHGVQIDVARARTYQFEISTYNQNVRNFTKKRYLLPIPQSFIDKRAASGIIDTNNTGW